MGGVKTKERVPVFRGYLKYLRSTGSYAGNFNKVFVSAHREGPLLWGFRKGYLKKINLNLERCLSETRMQGRGDISKKGTK